MPEVVGSTDAFPVDMTQAELDRTWHLDAMHMPFALTPLACDQIDHVLGQSFDHSYERFGMPQRNVGRTWNGRAYFSWTWNVPKDEEKAVEQRWIAIEREFIARTRAYWDDEAMPELRRIYRRIREIDVDGLDGAALAAAWVEAWAGMLRAWQIHFVAILGPYRVLEDLSDIYAAAIGPGRDVEALALVGGLEHELEDVEARLDDLTAMLAGSRELLAAVREQAAELDGLRDEPAPDEGRLDRDALRAAPAGAEFVTALDAFLDEHGHLGQTHDDLRYASFGAEPRLLLASLVGRLAGRAKGPTRTDRLAAARALAAERAEAVRAALAGKPDDLARFETTLAHAIEIGHLTEGHNYWIDRMSQATMRALAMRVGQRLVREGILEQRADVFFLRRDEVAQALVDGASRIELVRERKTQLEVDRARVAPPYLGVVPEDTEPDSRFSAAKLEPTTPDELRGTGASAGIVRGRARVVLSQDEFGRVQPGEIIVCPASNPSWVPVFTIAGGLVTNTGGVLSHAAVVAREFGLPAVTGVAEATSKIRTGRLVEIDGTAGTVRLL
jgi:phosphohistidine swiveling domain-containing protein